MCALAGSRGSGGSNPAGRWGAGEVGVVRSLGPKPETGQLSSWTGWLSEGERTDGNLECALKKKNPNCPPNICLSSGYRELRGRWDSSRRL